MKIIDELMNRYPQLHVVEDDIQKAYQILAECYENNGKLLTAGNGGSACDAQHIVGELMKGFYKERRIDKSLEDKLAAAGGERGKQVGRKLQKALPAISLSAQEGILTAIGNDIGYEYAAAQMLAGYGERNDVFLSISTSGNALNILNAICVAKAKEIKIIGLTGASGGKMKDACDVCICVPSTVTHEIQEMHIPIYHALCLMLEDNFF